MSELKVPGTTRDRTALTDVIVTSLRVVSMFPDPARVRSDNWLTGVTKDIIDIPSYLRPTICFQPLAPVLSPNYPAITTMAPWSAPLAMSRRLASAASRQKPTG